MEQKLRMTCFVANEHEAVENTFFAVKKLPKKVKPESTSAETGVSAFFGRFCETFRRYVRFIQSFDCLFRL